MCTQMHKCVHIHTHMNTKQKKNHILLRMVDMFGKYEYTVEDRVIDKIYGYNNKSK